MRLASRHEDFESPFEVRDWSLIRGRGGGLQNRRGVCEVLPLQKGGGAENDLAMMKGGTTSFEVVFTR